MKIVARLPVGIVDIVAAVGIDVTIRIDKTRVAGVVRDRRS